MTNWYDLCLILAMALSVGMIMIAVNSGVL